MKNFYKKISLVAILSVLFIMSFNFTAYARSNNTSIDEIKKRGYITVATNAEFPPFEYLENGEETGIDMDISKKIAEKLGVKLKVENVSFDSVILMLQNGMCDFSASALSYDKERANNVDFSEPYASVSQKILVLNDSSITSENDLINKKIGVQLGTTADKYCTQKNQFNVIRFAKPADALLDLLNKQISAVVIDEFSADNFIKNNNKIKKLDQNLSQENYNIAVSKGGTELLNIINEVINELKSTNELNNIIDKYTKKTSTDNKIKEYSSYIIDGLKNTLIMTFLSALIGIVIGILIASAKTAAIYNKKLKILGILSDFYTTVVRGTPALIQLFIVYYGIVGQFGIDKIIAAIIAFGLNSGAYVSEHIRAGILSVNKGQLEAGRSLGLNQKTTMVKIVIPQALKNILPSLGSEAITLLKETAVASYIGVLDLSRAGDIIRSTSYEALTPLLIVALIYLILVVGLTALLNKIERKIRKNDSR